MIVLLNSGKACQRQATRPARFGVEKEVPSPVVGSPVAEAMVVPAPTATRSGLIRPAEFGPQLENAAILPRLSVAPTVNTLSPSPGQPTIFVSPASAPELPAKASTIMPLATAKFAARVLMAV